MSTFADTLPSLSVFDQVLILKRLILQESCAKSGDYTVSLLGEG